MRDSLFILLFPKIFRTHASRAVYLVMLSLSFSWHQGLLEKGEIKPKPEQKLRACALLNPESINFMVCRF
jgi:hypothetical protein